MKKTLTIISIITILLQSCRKDEVTQAKAFIKNTTTHNIKIMFYKNGSVADSDTINLTSNKEVEIANGILRGLISVPGFNSKYAGSPNDSCVVVFDNLFKVSHYANLPDKLNTKFYDFNSLRNLLNPKSYVFTSSVVSKTKLLNIHIYEFTELDYLYTK
jgi:hypothetical protein